MAFHRGQKVVFVGKAQEGVPSRLLAKEGISLTVGMVYTIRDLEDVCGYAACRLVEIINEAKKYSRGFVEELWYFQSAFRPVVDISDLESIVSEVKLGRPRKIQDDQFDRKRVHSSAALPRQRDADTAAPEGVAPPCAVSAPIRTASHVTLTAASRDAKLATAGAR